MLRRILFIGGACLGVALMVSPAFGVRNTPAKAGKYSIEVIQGVEVCSAANTTAPGLLATQACDPVVPSDPGCVFGVKGKGKISAKIDKTGDIAVQAKISGIEPTCEGETLCAVASVRTSQNNCASTGDCSTINQVNLPLGVACGPVTKGKLGVKTTVNTALPGALVAGNAAEFTIGEVGLSRTGGGIAFRGGLLLP